MVNLYRQFVKTKPSKRAQYFNHCPFYRAASLLLANNAALFTAPTQVQSGNLKRSVLSHCQHRVTIEKRIVIDANWKRI